MRRGSSMVGVGLLAGSILAVSVAQADMTGSFDGNLAGKKLSQPLSAAAALSQTGRVVTGTVALPADLATFGGAYLLTGTATPKRIRLRGTGPGGLTFTWRARILGDTARGGAKVKGPGAKLVGSLALTRNVSAGDGSGCDAVFNQNQTVFVDQVLGQALGTCGACHAPGLQAGATRLHVTPIAPLATARAVALLVDSVNPSASRILQKPLNLVPHGGGLRIAAGSAQEQILQQWVDLVAQAHCN